ncbi:MAG: hypothetical protein L0H53_10250 [Candidatus Nitrosocosmicus sp.]|nr:hypothetical protein [Candidatus Nitrosocosmicus sp.]MDN5867044.1 hypothetical protein [Candidatus Nitrosocosmicus sp.]
MLGIKAVHHSGQSFINKYTKFANGLAGRIDIKLSRHADIIEDQAQRTAKRDTGNMANKTTKSKISKGYEVRGKADYTIFVHNGTRYMKADPYIKRSFDKEKPNIKKFTLKGLGL